MGEGVGVLDKSKAAKQLIFETGNQCEPTLYDEEGEDKVMWRVRTSKGPELLCFERAKTILVQKERKPKSTQT